MVYNHVDCRHPPGWLNLAIWPVGRYSNKRPVRAKRIEAVSLGGQTGAVALASRLGPRVEVPGDPS